MCELRVLPPVAPPAAPRVAQRASPAADPRLATTVADLTRRLRPACAHLDDGAFERLVQEIAAWKLRWATRDDPAPRA